MYIFKHALNNLFRNKGRNILMAAIIFAIIATTVTALIINNTSSAVIDDYRTRFGSEVSITPDTEKLREEAMNNSADGRITMRMPELSADLMLAFAQSETLQKTVAVGSIYANSDTITAIDQSEESEEETSDNPESAQNGSSPGGAMVTRFVRSMGNYRLYGDFWDDFDDGTRELTEDSLFPENDNECVISEDLADLNGISTGDTITFTAQMSVTLPEDFDTGSYSDGDIITVNDLEYTVNLDDMGNFMSASRDVDYTLTVTGIYYDLTDEYPNPNMSDTPAMNRRNEVLTTLNTLLEGRKADENSVSLEVTYYLRNPDLLDEFETYVRDLGLSDSFIVSTDTVSYDTVVRPVVSLKSISLAFMLIVLVLGSIILILLSSMAIRERKYEIGVLRAMGMKKRKVSLCLWYEILIITGLCLVVGIGTGTVISQPIADTLIAQQIEAISSENDRQDGNFMAGGAIAARGSSMGRGGPMVIGLTGANNAEPLSEIDVTVSLYTILQIIGIALLLSTVAGIISISKITKYEPIKILMERN